jgi:hypothetical protein
VLLRGIRLPAPQAALLRQHGASTGLRRHAGHRGSIHPGVPVLPRSWRWPIAWGASSGGMSYVPCRIALAFTLDRAWHRTVAIGVFGAMAAVGKLMGLGAEQMLHAFGIPYGHASGKRRPDPGGGGAVCPTLPGRHRPKVGIAEVWAMPPC